MVSWAFTIGLGPAAWIDLPHLGASGALAGAMGTYIIFFPRNRIIAPLFSLLLFGLIIKAPAWGYLGFWVVLQVIAVSVGADGGVDWWGHLGGFVAGVVVAVGYRILARR